ncbi:EamA family transporter, partial [Psychrobacter sp. ANT_H3]|nr:EamA family transporter [Psychrobacter sp. ANT_H3]
RHIEAYKVSSAEYSGLIGAVVVGIIWFNEVPNMTLLIGSALIILPLIWLATLESLRFRQKIG